MHTISMSVDGVNRGNCRRGYRYNMQLSAPSEPRNLTVSGKTESSLTIGWSQPSAVNGYLINYIVEWTMEGSQGSLWRDILTDSMEEFSKTYKIDNLNNGETYHITVKASNR